MDEGLTQQEILEGLVGRCMEELGLNRSPTEDEFMRWWGFVPGGAMGWKLPGDKPI